MKRKFKPAFHGILLGLKDSSIRLQLIFSIIAILFCLIFHLSFIECLFVFSAIIMVVVSETLNTCIEKICDFCTKEKNEKIRDIKDLAAAAVLFSAFYALIVGISILLNKFGGLI